MVFKWTEYSVKHCAFIKKPQRHRRGSIKSTNGLSGRFIFYHENVYGGDRHYHQ